MPTRGIDDSRLQIFDGWDGADEAGDSDTVDEIAPLPSPLDRRSQLNDGSFGIDHPPLCECDLPELMTSKSAAEFLRLAILDLRELCPCAQECVASKPILGIDANYRTRFACQMRRLRRLSDQPNYVDWVIRSSDAANDAI
jgi:hypothetical protein